MQFLVAFSHEDKVKKISDLRLCITASTHGDAGLLCFSKKKSADESL